MAEISVILPVYNAENYLKDAIDSILNQTYQNFELIIVNDGSTDSSEEIINSYKSNKIKYIENKENLGLIKSLNFGLDKAKGKYIVRMDADDISLPSRLKVQYNYMEENPDVVACGTYIQHFGENLKIRKYPLTDEDVRLFFVFRSPIAHPSAIMQAVFFKGDNAVQYNKDYLYAEDYKLWSDLMCYGKITNIPDCLLKYRVSATQITQKNGGKCIETSQKIRREYINAFFKENKHPNIPKKITLDEIKILMNKQFYNEELKNMIIYVYFLSLNQYSLGSLYCFTRYYLHLPNFFLNIKNFFRVVFFHFKSNKEWL